MATTNDPGRGQMLLAAEALLLERYGDGSRSLDPVRVMHAVCAATDGHSVHENRELPDASAEDALAALTQLDEARATLDALERDLTRAARVRGASWRQIAGALGLASRSSAESRFVRLERDVTSSRSDRYPERLRAERARDRAAR
ncbi:hypothetical protein [Streptomyces sp. NPDC060366]|uniref:hypothetical protein n=1 Tax=Streptomyces sp. NPDC060366 TaxID=3347105 RepID=UPI00365F24F0